MYIGDIMGCGVDFDTDVGQNYVKVFFTKNGRQIGESQKMKRPVHGLYPLFGKFILITFIVFSYQHHIHFKNIMHHAGTSFCTFILL